MSNNWLAVAATEALAISKAICAASSFKTSVGGNKEVEEVEGMVVVIVMETDAEEDSKDIGDVWCRAAAARLLFSRATSNRRRTCRNRDNSVAVVLPTLSSTRLPLSCLASGISMSELNGWEVAIEVMYAARGRSSVVDAEAETGTEEEG